MDSMKVRVQELIIEGDILRAEIDRYIDFYLLEKNGKIYHFGGPFPIREYFGDGISWWKGKREDKLILGDVLNASRVTGNLEKLIVKGNVWGGILPGDKLKEVVVEGFLGHIAGRRLKIVAKYFGSGALSGSEDCEVVGEVFPSGFGGFSKNLNITIKGMYGENFLWKSEGTKIRIEGVTLKELAEELKRKGIATEIYAKNILPMSKLLSHKRFVKVMEFLDEVYEHLQKPDDDILKYCNEKYSLPYLLLNEAIRIKLFNGKLDVVFSRKLLPFFMKYNLTREDLKIIRGLLVPYLVRMSIPYTRDFEYIDERELNRIELCKGAIKYYEKVKREDGLYWMQIGSALLNLQGDFLREDQKRAVTNIKRLFGLDLTAVPASDDLKLAVVEILAHAVEYYLHNYGAVKEGAKV